MEEEQRSSIINSQRGQKKKHKREVKADLIRQLKVIKNQDVKAPNSPEVSFSSGSDNDEDDELDLAIESSKSSSSNDSDEENKNDLFSKDNYEEMSLNTIQELYDSNFDEPCANENSSNMSINTEKQKKKAKREKMKKKIEKARAKMEEENDEGRSGCR